MRLFLEYIMGPLDGYKVEIIEATTWGSDRDEALSCPWDNELGKRQAVIYYQDDGWFIESYKVRHGTYIIRGGTMQRIEETSRLESGDTLKASETAFHITLE